MRIVAILMVLSGIVLAQPKCPKGQHFSCVGSGGICILGCWSDKDIEESQAGNCAEMGMGTLHFWYAPRWNYSTHHCEKHWYRKEDGKKYEISKEEFWRLWSGKEQDGKR